MLLSQEVSLTLYVILVDFTIYVSGEQQPYAHSDNPVVISLKFGLHSSFSTPCLPLKVCRCPSVFLFGKGAFIAVFSIAVCHLTRLCVCVRAPGSYNDM